MRKNYSATPLIFVTEVEFACVTVSIGLVWILLAAVIHQGLTRLAVGLSCTRDQHCFVAPLELDVCPGHKKCICH